MLNVICLQFSSYEAYLQCKCVYRSAMPDVLWIQKSYCAAGRCQQVVQYFRMLCITFISFLFIILLQPQ